jgi:hypothetical protein
MRSAKKARVVEEKGQEEEMEKQEERDDENKEDRKPRFTGEDIRNYSGEVERHHVFAAAFADLLPPQEGPLSNYWKQKLEGMEQEIKDMRISYAKLITCVFPPVFTLLPFFFKSFVFLIPPSFSPPLPSSKQAKEGNISEEDMGGDRRGNRGFSVGAS